MKQLRVVFINGLAVGSFLICLGAADAAANRGAAAATDAVPAEITAATATFDSDYKTKSRDDAASSGLVLLELCLSKKRHDLLVQNLPRVREAAANSDLGGQVELALAKSLQVNERKISESRAAYSAILERFPNDATACAGALLQLAQLERFVDGDALKTIETCDQIIGKYPAPKYLGDAYLCRLRAGASIRRSNVVRETLNGLEKHLKGTRAVAVAYGEVADYEFNVTGDQKAAQRMWRNVVDSAAGENSVGKIGQSDLLLAQARIRLADHGHQGDFDKAIRDLDFHC